MRKDINLESNVLCEIVVGTCIYGISECFIYVFQSNAIMLQFDFLEEN